MSEPPIPAEHAEFFWNAQPGKAPHEFVVTDMRERFRVSKERGHDPTRRYDSSMGAHVADWLTGKGPHDTPEGLFATEWLGRGATDEQIRAALEQIGRIDRCEWARQMLAAMRYFDRGD